MSNNLAQLLLRKRAENLARAKALEKQGQVTQARDLYTKCIDVSPEMAAQVIKALRHEKVAYVVAPYEADAQLAFLEKEGFVDGIITEDSDLLVFGCKNVIFKLDSDGNCVNIKRERFGAVTEAPMVGWSDKEFRHMAVRSPSVHSLLRKLIYRIDPFRMRLSAFHQWPWSQNRS